MSNSPLLSVPGEELDSESSGGREMITARYEEKETIEGEIDHNEEEKKDRKEGEADREDEGSDDDDDDEGSQILTPSSPEEDGVQEETAESMHGGDGKDRSEEATVVAMAVAVVEGDDDDGGYHTPTSPRHRIPADLPCPPAPKKPRARSPPPEISKAGRDREFRRVRRRLVEISGGVELLFSCRIKEARGDEVVR